VTIHPVLRPGSHRFFAQFYMDFLSESLTTVYLIRESSAKKKAVNGKFGQASGLKGWVNYSNIQTTSAYPYIMEKFR
jgi:hypothetical protein